MASRKKHTKSRRGCLNCKRRHVKCDETQPQCGHCQRLCDDCIFPAVVPGQYALGRPAFSVSKPRTHTSPPSPTPLPDSLAHDLITALQQYSSNHARRTDRYNHDTSQTNHAPSSSQPAPDMSRSNGTNSSSSDLDSAPLLPCRDLLDLRLFHHYTINTSATWDLTAQPMQKKIWQDPVVRLACSQQHIFLLHGLLAVAACHLTADMRESPDNRLRIWPKRATDHFDSAITGFRAVLEQGQEETSTGGYGEVAPEAIFVFACILVVYNFADAKLRVKRNVLPDDDTNMQDWSPNLHVEKRGQAINGIDTHEDPISTLLTSCRLVRGASTLMRPHFASVMASEFAPLITNARVGEPHVVVEPLIQLREWIENLPQANPSLIPAADSQKISTYLDAVTQLHRVSANIREYGNDGGILGQIFNWPVEIEESFLESLEEREPIPLVILAYFTTLLTVDDECWWLAGWDSKILGSIEKELGQAGELLQWLAWPISQIIK